MLKNHCVHFSILHTSVLIRLITFLYPYVTAICKILNWERSATKIWQIQGQSRIYHFNSHLITKTRFDLAITMHHALITVKCKLRAFSYSKASLKSFTNQNIVKSRSGHHEKIANRFAKSFST